MHGQCTTGVGVGYLPTVHEDFCVRVGVLRCLNPPTRSGEQMCHNLVQEMSRIEFYGDSHDQKNPNRIRLQLFGRS
jgi:hypothetical protein